MPQPHWSLEICALLSVQKHSQGQRNIITKVNHKIISLTYKIKRKVLLIYIFIHILGSHMHREFLHEASDHLRFHKLAYTDLTQRAAKGVGSTLPLCSFDSRFPMAFLS